MNFLSLLQSHAVLCKALENAKFVQKPVKKPLDKPSLYFVSLENDKVFIFPSLEQEEDAVLKECAEFEFAKVNAPVCVIFSVAEILPKEIDENVKLFMREFGVDTVRGGSYLDVVLPPDVLQSLAQTLKQELA
jgi:hypothetical protein